MKLGMFGGTCLEFDCQMYVPSGVKDFEMPWFEVKFNWWAPIWYEKCYIKL